MKKTLIIPLLILSLLIVAGILRWDVGATQTFEKSLKVQILKDRWTGQTWVKLNGSLPKENFHSWSYAWLFASERDFWDNREHNEPWPNILRGINIKPDTSAFYTGETLPYFQNSIVKSMAIDVREGKAGIDKANELKRELETANKNKMSHSQGHTQYLELYRSMEYDQEIAAKDVNRANDPQIQFWEKYSDRIMPNLSTTIRTYIPAAIVAEYDKWQEADRQIQKINYQISNIEYWDKAEALKQLTKEANNTKNILTIAWVVLMALPLIALILLFMSSAKKSRISQEIIIK